MQHVHKAGGLVCFTSTANAKMLNLLFITVFFFLITTTNSVSVYFIL